MTIDSLKFHKNLSVCDADHTLILQKKKKKREVRSKIMRKRLEKESSEYISNGMIETLNSPSTNTDVDNADMFAEVCWVSEVPPPHY
tara:strand:- start:608 stop:868 length:261 start_codon:yes stop_codon:yes gene_type:complete